MLIVVTGTDMYADGNLQTGLWLSELTHIYHCAEEAGYASFPGRNRLHQAHCVPSFAAEWRLQP